jgi:hypothetical protein
MKEKKSRWSFWVMVAICFSVGLFLMGAIIANATRTHRLEAGSALDAPECYTNDFFSKMSLRTNHFYGDCFGHDSYGGVYEWKKCKYNDGIVECIMGFPR